MRVHLESQSRKNLWALYQEKFDGFYFGINWSQLKVTVPNITVQSQNSFELFVKKIARQLMVSLILESFQFVLVPSKELKISPQTPSVPRGRPRCGQTSGRRFQTGAADSPKGWAERRSQGKRWDPTCRSAWKRSPAAEKSRQPADSKNTFGKNPSRGRRAAYNRVWWSARSLRGSCKSSPPCGRWRSSGTVCLGSSRREAGLRNSWCAGRESRCAVCLSSSQYLRHRVAA